MKKKPVKRKGVYKTLEKLCAKLATGKPTHTAKKRATHKKRARRTARSWHGETKRHGVAAHKGWVKYAKKKCSAKRTGSGLVQKMYGKSKAEVRSRAAYRKILAQQARRPRKAKKRAKKAKKRSTKRDPGSASWYRALPRSRRHLR